MTPCPTTHCEWGTRTSGRGDVIGTTQEGRVCENLLPGTEEGETEPVWSSGAPRVASTACWLLCFWGGSEDPRVWVHSLFSQRPRNPALTPMEPWRSLALLAGSLALVSALVALSTDFWFVAIGPSSSAHSGLWPKGGSAVTDCIHVTQTFSILAALCGLGSVGLLVLSCIPSLSAPGRGPLVSSITAFVAALFMVVAMAVYTSHRWSQPQDPQIQSCFAWSFYLGWVSALLWFSAGSLGLVAHSRAPQSGYEEL
ncbi:protein NKG7 [Myotis daubentonii]|uniref:protein NKG7 n=1 Tax=Myotis daubentonii TaxID=98922 RepID=UPI002873E1EE|nr:protein NKG7 [Myotis daubentonii]